MLFSYRLKVFKEVATLLSFSQAAKKLGISQPAVSMNIQEIERLLDTDLFIREPGSISLTKSGKLLLEHILNIEREENRFLLDLQMLNNQMEGKFTCAISSEQSISELEPFINGYKKLHPKMDIKIISDSMDDIAIGLCEGSIDLAITGLHYSPIVERNANLAALAFSALKKPMWVIVDKEKMSQLVSSFVQYLLIR